MTRNSSAAALRKLTEDEMMQAVGGANPVVVRLAAKVLIAAFEDAYENPISVGGLLEAGRQKLKK